MLRCVIATLGNDAPGVNAAVRAVTRLALNRNLEVYGAKQGWLGLLEGKMWKLKQPDVDFVLGKGGSVLGSTDYKIRPDDNEAVDKIAETLKKFDLAVVTGGLGSFAVLNRVYDAHHMGTTTTIFIPASIEGEFLDPKTDRGYASIHGESIGSDTAANTAVDAIDRLREQSHHSRSVFLVECVGQKSNLLPVQIGMACGAHRVYLPRFPHVEKEAVTEIQSLYGSDFDPNYVNIGELVSWIESMFQNHRRNHVLVVLPNGVPLINTMPRGAVDEQINYEEMITSMSPLELTVLRVADALSSHFHGPNAIQVRHVLLDDLQRGGAPSAHDRVLGSLYGEAAVEEFLSLFNGLDTVRRGNLNLLTIDSTSSVTWKCHPRLDVLPLFAGGEPRAGGLDPLPFFRQCRGLVTGYRPLSTLSTTAN